MDSFNIVLFEDLTVQEANEIHTELHDWQDVEIALLVEELGLAAEQADTLQEFIQDDFDFQGPEDTRFEIVVYERQLIDQTDLEKSLTESVDKLTERSQTNTEAEEHDAILEELDTKLEQLRITQQQQHALRRKLASLIPAKTPPLPDASEEVASEVLTESPTELEASEVPLASPDLDLAVPQPDRPQSNLRVEIPASPINLTSPTELPSHSSLNTDSSGISIEEETVPYSAEAAEEAYSSGSSLSSAGSSPLDSPPAVPLPAAPSASSLDSGALMAGTRITVDDMKPTAQARLRALSEQRPEVRAMIGESNEESNDLLLEDISEESNPTSSKPLPKSSIQLPICFPLRLAFVITYCTRVHPQEITNKAFWGSLYTMTEALYPSSLGGLGIPMDTYATYCAYFNQRQNELQGSKTTLSVIDTTNGQPIVLTGIDTERRLTLLCTAILYGCMKGSRRGMAKVDNNTTWKYSYNPWMASSSISEDAVGNTAFLESIVDADKPNSLTSDLLSNIELSTALGETCPPQIEIISYRDGRWYYVDFRPTPNLIWMDLFNKTSGVDAVNRPWLFAYFLMTSFPKEEDLRQMISGIAKNTQRDPSIVDHKPVRPFQAANLAKYTQRWPHA